MGTKETLSEKFLISSVYGVGRTLVGLPLEHPFDCAKTVWQASPEKYTSALQVFKTIYSKGGVVGFYSGVLPSIGRLTLKQVYRWPLMLLLPPFFKSISPDRMRVVIPSYEKILTGFSLAVVDTIILCPLERLKVVLMTTPLEVKNNRLISWFRNNSSSLGKELFRGINPIFAKQLVSWSSFLVVDEQCKRFIRKDNPNAVLGVKSLLAISVIVGVCNTASTMPFDAVKTMHQKLDPVGTKGVFKTMGKIIESHGIHGLYTGWQIRICQYLIQSIFTVALLDRLEQRFK
eukprot:TRINITY_DN1540_c0_g3_i2.p1 TRINITY_DN1540_c0_g3~~TRINITY_DN1540_c0_g3_i2.p1  ORF type:complete len:289 (+),score=36.57 TRINITY_DN1540_c0_g3_i2:178-1044(+)